ncbi:MAG: PBSX family phage terminase large subunit [Coprobacillus sp.]
METKTVRKKRTIPYNFSEKHIGYIKNCIECEINVAEGAIRAGKTVDNIYAFAYELRNTEDRIHLATGSTVANAKLNIGDANGFGLEYIFRGQSSWGKYKSNEALFICGPATKYKQRIVIFAGSSKENNYKSIRGNSYGMWIATEINLHHDKTIKEAFNRTVAASKRKIFWDLNPDNPNAKIYKEYIDKYAKQLSDGTLLGGYNYKHFTIDDNINISDERKAVIKSQYDPNSIWYLRDILGMRVVAEGLIYRTIAERTRNDKQSYLISAEDVRDVMEINVGVDFGGSGSAHAFVASAITRSYSKIIVLSSERHLCDSQEIDPNELGMLFVDFCLKVLNLFGNITNVYCDSAEQTLIAGLKSSARNHGLGWLRIGNALKTEINDRIRLTTRMFSQGRLLFVEGQCDTLINALCQAVWDPKEITKFVRLDDGTSDIDSLDGFEYTYEKSISRFIRTE